MIYRAPFPDDAWLTEGVRTRRVHRAVDREARGIDVIRRRDDFVAVEIDFHETGGSHFVELLPR